MLPYCGILLIGFIKLAVGDGSLDMLHKSTVSIPQIRHGDPCIPGKMYKVDCNTCKCTDAGALMCTKMACVDWKKIIDNRKKKPLRSNSNNKNESHRRTNKKLPTLKQGELCKPGKLYRSECNRCFCTSENKIVCSLKAEACTFDKHGNPPPIYTLEDIHTPIENTQGLTALNSASDKCNPGDINTVDCNQCLCLEAGHLFCTMKMCISYDDIHKMAAVEMSGKPCSESSSDNCKQCDCVNGKTACSLIPNCKPDTKMLLSGGIEPPQVLDGSYTKCVPDTIYKSNCNKCYCQDDGTLRCTQKTCLNYSQIKLLEKQRQYVEKHGL